MNNNTATKHYIQIFVSQKVEKKKEKRKNMGKKNMNRLSAFSYILRNTIVANI